MGTLSLGRKKDEMENGNNELLLTDEEKSEIAVFVRIANEKKLMLAEIQFRIEIATKQMNALTQQKQPILDEIMKVITMLDERAVKITKSHGINTEDVVRGLWRLDTDRMALVPVDASISTQSQSHPNN